MAVVNISRTLNQSSSYLTTNSTDVNTGYIEVDETCAVSASTVIAVAVDVSTLTVAYLYASVANTTLDFDGSTPTITITDPQIPYLWQVGCNMVNVLSADFTTITAANPSATDVCTLTFRFGYTV